MSDEPKFDVRGRMVIERMSHDTRLALMALKRALADEPGMIHAQVTLDQVGVADVPPTIDGVLNMPRSEFDGDRFSQVSIRVRYFDG